MSTRVNVLPVVVLKVIELSKWGIGPTAIACLIRALEQRHAEIVLVFALFAMRFKITPWAAGLGRGVRTGGGEIAPRFQRRWHGRRAGKFRQLAPPCVIA